MVYGAKTCIFCLSLAFLLHFSLISLFPYFCPHDIPHFLNLGGIPNMSTHHYSPKTKKSVLPYRQTIKHTTFHLFVTMHSGTTINKVTYLLGFFAIFVAPHRQIFGSEKSDEWSNLMKQKVVRVPVTRFDGNEQILKKTKFIKYIGIYISNDTS